MAPRWHDRTSLPPHIGVTPGGHLFQCERPEGCTHAGSTHTTGMCRCVERAMDGLQADLELVEDAPAKGSSTNSPWLHPDPPRS